MKPILSFVESRKFYVALIGFILVLVQVYYPSLPVWYAPVVSFLTAIGVFSVPNTPKVTAPAVVTIVSPTTPIL